ncbi:ABC transporter permease [Aureimonas sp. SA4125]|uniref:type I secretion system permease/ATPase n=1 Tax=Aureimonas sp. SA4125 TaxID=2826993 RepID=UPI001CC773C0|nr:type I secretion system permease/ATPase [Aureimonas sp. SA4125]BDA83936.1 ABC transporter permease [Aureimonas sp. SA4125]
MPKGIERPTRNRLATIFWSGIAKLAWFTLAVDVLLLVQPIYMLQVYDRVLTSGSIETLIFTSVIACAALALLAVLDSLRAAVASRIAAQMDVDGGADALLASMNGPRAALGDVQPLRDLTTVRGFISNRGILAFLDIPFVPLFMAILYLIHPNIFFLALAGAVVLTLIALLNQVVASRVAGASADQVMASMLSAQAFARCAESIQAMGMRRDVIAAWGRDEALALAGQGRMEECNAAFAGISRALRLGLQIAILGYGGYLVLAGEMTGGMIFASSLISGRALQPIDQVIAGWRGFVETRRAWKRLAAALDARAVEAPATSLPVPLGRIELQQVVVFPANASGGDPILKRISAVIEPGQCVAIVGPSGAGKSTLARVIVGAVALRGGAVRIDGADITTWRSDQLGRQVGYLAQDVDLLPGTVAQNIARFSQEADDASIVRAAMKAQVHDLILGLPKAYDTLIGPMGQQLSGGQRQRIGLARAFFGEPRMLILDEPNASLDAEGSLALERALEGAKREKITVVVVTQRMQIADLADKIMMLRNGAIEDFGPRADVVRRQAERGRTAPKAKPGSSAEGAGLPAANVAAPKAHAPHQVVSARFAPALVGPSASTAND